MKIFKSIRSRLQMTLLIVVIPAFILMFWFDISERYERLEKSKGEIQSLSMFAKRTLDEFFDTSRMLLMTIAQTEEIQNKDYSAVSEFLNVLNNNYPHYTFIGLTDTQGNVVAGSVPKEGDLNISTDSWFPKVLTTGDFTIGGYSICYITKEPVLAMAIPILGMVNNPENNSDGKEYEIKNILFLTMRLDWFKDIVKDFKWTGDYVFNVVDMHGTVITRYPDPDRWIGKHLPENPLTKRMFLLKNRVVELPGLDGIERIFAFSASGYKDDYIYLSIGLSRDYALKEIDTDIKIHIISLIFAICLGMFLSWLFSRHYIITPLNMLKEASNNLASRKFDINPEILRKEDEFGQLGRTFFSMANSIEAYVESERKIDRKIRESEARLKSVMDTTHSIILVTTVDGVILEFNKEAEKVYNVKREDVLGKNYKALFIKNKEDLEVYINSRDKILNGIPLHNFERLRTVSDGTELWFSWNADRLIDNKGNLIGFIAVGDDITERKKAEDARKKAFEEIEGKVESRTKDLHQTQKVLMNLVDNLNLKTKELEAANIKLLELDRLKSTFIASMSHELRTPLNSIIGFSSIILNGWSGKINDEQRENLSIVVKAGKHLLSLINDVIDVSKIEAGRVEPYIEDFDVFDLFSEAMVNFKREAEAKGLEIKCRLIHEKMHTDKRRLLQSLLNLISNAVKYTEKGSIQIGMRRIKQPSVERGELISIETPYVEISVEDTGIGINEEDKVKIFRSFARIETGKKPQDTGTGLGLYLTRKLVTEVLQGEISFTSEYGKGSRFVITVPTSI